MVRVSRCTVEDQGTPPYTCGPARGRGGMADALVSGTSGATRGGSSPLDRMKPWTRKGPRLFLGLVRRVGSLADGFGQRRPERGLARVFVRLRLANLCCRPWPNRSRPTTFSLSVFRAKSSRSTVAMALSCGNGRHRRAPDLSRCCLTAIESSRRVRVTRGHSTLAMGQHCGSKS